MKVVKSLGGVYNKNMGDLVEKIMPAEKIKVDSIGKVFDNLIRLSDGGNTVTFTVDGKPKDYSLWIDDFTVSVATRIAKFMGDERGIGFVPNGGSEIALRESIVAGVFNTSLKIGAYVDRFNKNISEIQSDKKTDDGADPVKIIVDTRTGYITDVILDVKELSGQDDYDPKEGLRKSQLEPVLAACMVNEETCRRTE